MSSDLVRAAGAVLAGVVAGGTTTMLMESLGTVLMPLPSPAAEAAAAAAAGDTAPLAQVMADGEMPTANLSWVCLSWGVAAAVASGVAQRIAKRRSAGVRAGVVMLLLTCANFFAFPHPLWMQVTGCAAVGAGTYAGLRARRP